MKSITTRNPIRRWLGLAVAAALLLPISIVQVHAEPDLNDQSMADKIDDELLHDPGVIAAKVDVRSADGVVTLTGQVDNILAKERATRVAETVRGVRSVVNRIRVQPSVSRIDEAIQRDVEAALLKDPAADAYQLVATVSDSVVSLTGTVESYREKELAANVVKGVQGVTGLNNQIIVQYATDRSDREIEQEVEQSLRWNARVDDHLINVKVESAEVVLAGTVGSASEQRLAEFDAWVAGVESVDTSELSVKSWARDRRLRSDKDIVKSESELKKALEAALLYDPRVSALQVDVDVSGTMVTLRGTVDNLQSKRSAEQDAQNTVGVSNVDNRLKVRPEKVPSDEDISKDLDAALRRDPYLERFQFTINSVDGTAHLYGSVDSFYEKQRADELASRIPGVVDVRNHIHVEDNIAYIHDPYIDDGYFGSDPRLGNEPREMFESDLEIKAAIESELWWSPFVSSADVGVSVSDGIVTLTGTVNSRSERQVATENAYEGGATLVKNELVVGEAGE